MSDLLDRVIAADLALDDEYGATLTNHLPMAATALHVMAEWLGPTDAQLVSFDAHYRRRLEPLRVREALLPLQRLPREAVLRNLGDFDLTSSFHELFEAALAKRSPADVVAEWLPLLGPGLPGAAGHGVLRVYFALLASSQVRPETARAELARALAYAAGRFRELRQAVTPRSPRPRALLETLAAPSFLTEAERALLGEFGLILYQHSELAARPEFQLLVAGTSVGFEWHAVLALLAHVACERPGFVLLHALTVGQALCALEQLLPAVDPEPHRRGWVDFAVAAWLCEGLSLPVGARPVGDVTALAAAARGTLDDHGLKAAYALHDLYARFGDPVFLAAGTRLCAMFTRAA
ncbi:MAG: DUF4243 domain-containing protein [Deltaproteobacteria bacterium]|nr:DUF4243 domain-containing protein [Deltaproteobacteria bacterium]